MGIEDYKNSPEHAECLERMRVDLVSRYAKSGGDVAEIIDEALHEAFEYGYESGKYDKESGE